MFKFCLVDGSLMYVEILLFDGILLILLICFCLFDLALDMEQAAERALQSLEVVEIGVSDRVFETLTAVRAYLVRLRLELAWERLFR